MHRQPRTVDGSWMYIFSRQHERDGARRYGHDCNMVEGGTHLVPDEEPKWHGGCRQSVDLVHVSEPDIV